jgi:membrane associated rhomboid family serine protease
MSAPEPSYCYRHPDRETGLACSECGRAICPDCATFAAVGIRCPDHAGARGGKKPMQVKPPKVHRAQGVALSTNAAPVTYALIAINIAIYLITAAQGAGLDSPGGALYNKFILLGSNHVPVQLPTGQTRILVLPYGDLAHDHQWWRLITTTFLHASLLHIGANMLSLFFVGRPVEQYLGRARYLGLYLVSGLAGSAGALMQSRYIPGLGASGAVFGVLGSMLVLEWQVTGRLAGQAMTWIVINLALSFSIPGISWGAHIGGLIAGILITLGYAHWRGGRAQYGQLGIMGVFVLIAVAVGSVAIAYLRARGYT